MAISPLELPLVPHQYSLIVPDFPPTGARCLRYALVDLRLGYVRHSWCMYLSIVNVGLERN
jgi:hypothetical protein